MTKLAALLPGGVLVVPHAIAGAPILFVIEKAKGERAAFTIVNTDPELLAFHPARGEPPKIRYQTCLTLADVDFARIKDEAFWGLAYWVAVTSPDKSYAMSPIQVLYKILLPFLANASLEEILHHQKERPEDEGAAYRSPQRSETGQLRGLVEAFQFLMRKRAMQPAARKEVSLLLRLEMVELALHDMAYVQQLSTAERTLLHIACRQVSHSASKLGQMLAPDGADVLSLEQIKAIQGCIELLRAEMAQLPCGDAAADVAPPPLILCEEEADKLSLSLESLLGASLLTPPSGADFYTVLGVSRDADEDEIKRAYKKAALREHPDKNPLDREAAEVRFKCVTEAYEGINEGKVATLGRVSAAEALAEVEVVGLYFTASWCGPCRQATPQLAETYKKLRKKHGKAFEMVCVSHDASEAAFEKYFAKMPWLALPFQSLHKTVLSEMFDVQGIPTLVLLDKKAKLISTDGLRILKRHMNHFPWAVQAPPQVPHQHALFDRMMRHGDVDAGAPKQLLRYAPVDYLQQPATVTCLEAAIAAIRYCDRLCTRVSVQDHCIKNGPFHNIACIQYTFSQLVPIPKAVDELAAGSCLWRTSTMLYAEQLDLMLLLSRIMEHFVAAAFSVDHTRAMDAVRMVVPACIAAVADVIMRHFASDFPSEVCVHLAGGIRGRLPASDAPSAQPHAGSESLEAGSAPAKNVHKTRGAARRGFGLSAGALAVQSASIEVFCPELNTARTRVLDYFESLDVDKIMCWENGEKFEDTTKQFLEQISYELAFPMGVLATPTLLADDHGLLIKNFPEWKCYRDISFYFKLFQNPHLEVLSELDRSSGQAYCQRDVELKFRYNYEEGKGPFQRFLIYSFSDGTRVVCRPKLQKGEMAPAHRFPSLADPSHYTQPYFVESEADVLHMWDLPDFGPLDVGQSRALGQQDSEMLLSYLTVPYMRVPLIMAFFSSDDRIHALQSRQLQQVLLDEKLAVFLFPCYWCI